MIIFNGEVFNTTEVKIENRNYLKIELNWKSLNIVIYVFDHKIAKLSDIRIISTKKEQIAKVTQVQPEIVNNVKTEGQLVK